jgi:1,4-dihydroxy-2-naphthoate octaprenyltransferase
MFSRSSWLHLRIPFSYFLLPVFIFSLSISPNLHAERLLWVFIIIHLLLYPASNGYNSYFDKDEGSIGGLKNPPPVKRELYYLVLLLDALAIVLGYLMVNWLFAMMLFIYGIVSKAYSHPVVRLKKMPIVGWFIAGLFQGAFTFLMCYIGINQFSLETLWRPEVLTPALLTTLMLWGNYPMTQIYQHEEDVKRGDVTLSARLGIRGTFHFTALVFSLAVAGFILYFWYYHQVKYVVLMLVFLAPVLVYFGIWYIQTRQNELHANYQKTMWLNFISATCLNAFFVYFFVDSSQVMQALQGGY